jgi:putative membrane protein
VPPDRVPVPRTFERRHPSHMAASAIINLLPPDDRGRSVGSRGRTFVSDLVVRVLINAAALWVAVQVVPDNLLSFDFGSDWWKLLAVALIFALVNSFIRPIVKLLSFPISVMTLGLVSFVINAAMLLLTALLSDQLDLGFKVGDFPPNITIDTLVGALVGSLIISLVSTLVSIVLSSRKLL